MDTFLIKENGGWRGGGSIVCIWIKEPFFRLPTFKLNKALSSDPDLVKIGLHYQLTKTSKSGDK